MAGRVVLKSLCVKAKMCRLDSVATSTGFFPRTGRYRTGNRARQSRPEISRDALRAVLSAVADHYLEARVANGRVAEEVVVKDRPKESGGTRPRRH